ncbi:MAG: hypothetical protein K9J06_04675 [Flavobacteriales bacterium]|nr:hypothetical protein [Flavobacteriales bacterium]
MRHILSAIVMLTFVMPTTVATAQDNQCDNVNALLTASQEYFKDVRGEVTTFEIRGVAKPYQKSNTSIKEGVTTYITEDEWYPELVSYLAKTRFYSEELQNEYDRMKKLMADCLGPDWVFVEKDKTNDIYLEDTEYKKAVFTENKKGKKVKIEVFMYNQRELDSWCVEFKMYGIGKKL